MSTVTDDIKHLMQELQKSVDVNGAVNLQLLLQEALRLFEKLKAVLPETTEEERKQIIAKMAEMHSFLMGESKRLSSQTGLSEAQILRFAENPDNFSKEQWDLLRGVRSVMDSQGRDIRQIMQKFSVPPVPPPSKETASKEAEAKAPAAKRPKQKIIKEKA
jgi:hypothetical protein